MSYSIDEPLSSVGRPPLPRRKGSDPCHHLRYDMAQDYATDDEERITIAALRKTVLQKLNLHASVLQEWGVDPTKEIPPSPATTNYIDFLLAMAAGKVDGAKGSDKSAKLQQIVRPSFISDKRKKHQLH